MKIEFESRSEIDNFCELLQDIYPAALVIDTDDMADVAFGNSDRDLPWNSDGYHMSAHMRTEETVNKKVDNKADKGADKNANNPDALYTYDQVFGRGVVWEEVTMDGKKYLRRVISGLTPFQREEDMIYLAGQLDAWYQMVGIGVRRMADVADATGLSEPYLVDMCRIWSRRMAGPKSAQYWFRVTPNGGYEIVDWPHKEETPDD